MGSATLDGSPEVFHEQRELGSEPLQLIGDGRNVSVPILVDRSLEGSGDEPEALEQTRESESEGRIRARVCSGSLPTGIHYRTELIRTGAHGFWSSTKRLSGDISGQEKRTEQGGFPLRPNRERVVARIHRSVDGRMSVPSPSDMTASSYRSGHDVTCPRPTQADRRALEWPVPHVAKGSSRCHLMFRQNGQDSRDNEKPSPTPLAVQRAPMG
jgi:hypothetical protein